jgi:uncharacterized protein with FMN-binding domain
MKRSIPAVLLTAAVAVPAGAVWTATHTASHAAATPKATPTPTHTSSKKKKTKTTTRTFTGPSEDMQWGPVQVTVTIKNKKVTDVQASAPMERARSQFINEQALPMLRQEVLQAQSANIDLIGGATMTSEAYDASLQAALDAAHKAHAI